MCCAIKLSFYILVENFLEFNILMGFLLAVLMSFNDNFFLIYSMMVSFYEQMPSCAILCDSRTKTNVY